MIGLDTNVLVRYLAQDDERQSAQAAELIESLTTERPGFVGLVTLAELVWVMQGCYAATRNEIASVLDRLLRTKELIVENAETALQALAVFAASNADYADCLIERSGHGAGCECTFTFDLDASRTAGMRLL